MPRCARKKSESGIYHVMLRGIDKRQIFEDKEDYEKFLEVLKKCKVISGFDVFAYCLMGNHIHLLLKVEKEPLELIIKRIGSRYVYWYNAKYKRSGHLFQDRFKSEAVDDDSYFLTVIRYIHQNPVKAGMCKNIEDYEYSSYREYVTGARLTDINYVYQIISKDEFERYNHEENTDKCLEIETGIKIRFTDEQAMRLIEKKSKCKTVTEFQNLDLKNRNELIAEFKRSGLSIRQISRLTGTSKGIVERCLRK